MTTEPVSTELPTAGQAPASTSASSPVLRLRDWVREHPLAVVALGAATVALGHAIWIWTHRQVGALDPDESGYLANAFRFQRSIDPLRPWLVVREIATTGTGPVVPALSTFLLLLGPNDPRTAMMVQPILLVVCSVGVAGITRRLAGPYVSIAAGLMFATAPTVVLATQSYWLGLGAATWAVLSMWALMGSQRLTNRWVYAYGIALGLMVVTRTMALGFVPGLVLAGVVMAGRDRRSWIGLLRAGAVCVLVAVPWWCINWSSLTEYLFSYGYGERAGLFGSGTVLDRFEFRMDRMLNGTLVAYMLPLLIVTGFSSAVSVLRRALRGQALRGAVRPVAALGVVVAAGMAALVSTSNNGVWFELPLVALLVPLLAWWLSFAWRPLQILVLVAFAAAAVSTLGRSWWLIAPDIRWPPDASHYEYGFAQYDERFGPDRREELDAAATDWRATNERVADALADIGDASDAMVVVMSGNMQLLNNNSVGLAGELTDRPLVIMIPDTTRSRESLEEDLRPWPVGEEGSGTEKVVVISRHDQILFTPDAGVARFDRLAAELHWEPVESIAMPDGGEVTILRHPGS